LPQWRRSCVQYAQTMLTIRLGCSALVLLFAASSVTAQAVPRKGKLLRDMTWMEARDQFTPDTVIVVPLGAEAKEHGPHLPLGNDWNMAEYLKDRVLRDANVIVAPTINYSFYPTFVEYPGSTHLRLETARDTIVDISTSLAKHGPKRIYILNTGVSTLRPLSAAAEVLAKQGILMRFTDILRVAGEVEKQVRQQKEGTHADEIETSWMLYAKPETVNMSKASADYPTGQGPLTPNKNVPGRYSPSGIFGDATLATKEKGEKIVEATVTGVLKEIEELRLARLP
jgi:creatinine amidohydrolase